MGVIGQGKMRGYNTKGGSRNTPLNSNTQQLNNGVSQSTVLTPKKQLNQP